MVRVQGFSNLGPLTHEAGDVVNDDPITWLQEVFAGQQSAPRSYVRGGGCRSGCGACCEFVIIPVDRRVLQSNALADWEKWLNLHGIDLQTTPEKVEVRIPIPCGALEADKSCGVHDTDERPDMCDSFPSDPMQLPNAGLEERCTYTWEEE